MSGTRKLKTGSHLINVTPGIVVQMATVARANVVDWGSVSEFLSAFFIAALQVYSTVLFMSSPCFDFKICWMRVTYLCSTCHQEDMQLSWPSKSSRKHKTFFKKYLLKQLQGQSSPHLTWSVFGCLQKVVVDVISYPHTHMIVASSTPALAKNVIIGMLFFRHYINLHRETSNHLNE